MSYSIGKEKVMDWIEWEQGPCPVDEECIVTVQMDNDDILVHLPAGEIDWDFPGDPVVRYHLSTSN